MRRNRILATKSWLRCKKCSRNVYIATKNRAIALKNVAIGRSKCIKCSSYYRFCSRTDSIATNFAPIDLGIVAIEGCLLQIFPFRYRKCSKLDGIATKKRS